MRIKILSHTLLILTVSLASFAQRNPYKEIGKKTEVLTLTNGKYEEFFDDEDVQQIGTALVGIRANKVVKLLTEDEAEKRLDNSAGKRFLSVDPLTNKFPMLTPYQYASNRPIDGTDLDGKEWDKAVSYDIMKGEFSVQLHCKIKITCSSNSTADVKAIGEAYVSSFTNAFNNLYDNRRKIKYTATAEYEILNGEPKESDYTVDLFTATQTKDNLHIAGVAGSPNTQSNSVSVASSTLNTGSGTETPKSPQVVGRSITHEIVHTANVKHPFDPENTAADVDLSPSTQNINGKPSPTFTVSPGADKAKVLTNVMIYTTVSFP